MSHIGRLRAAAGRSDLRAGIATGILSSTFSTLFVQLGARQIGRDPAVDWMEVGTVPLRRRALRRRPDLVGQAAGIASHQGADILWATVMLGGLLRPVPASRRRTAILTAAAPWAAATAAAELYVFLPWIQPLLRMQVPYWTALGVHTSSAAAYPLFLAIRHGDRRSGRWTTAALLATLGALAALRLSERRGRVPRWPQSAQRQAADIDFLYRMTGHHRTGRQLAELAADRADHPNLRALAELMVAEHVAEMDLMETWHRSWTGEPVPPLRDSDRRQMKGMPDEGTIAELARLEGRDFDRRFVPVMADHHLGAVHMSERTLARTRDPRMRAFAATIAHSQRRQIEAMRRRRLGV